MPADKVSPTVRIALAGGQAERNGTLEAPTVRLAAAVGACGPNGSLSPKAFERHLPEVSQEGRPALLVSYYYLEPFLKNKTRYYYRDWVMDSGAFSAHNSGASVDLRKYIAKCKELLVSDPTLTEVFSLDVIGDWRASEKNVERMWAAGVPAIPTYHVGEPVELLKAMAKSYPKIALGGAVGYKRKNAWAAQCFARVWPAKIHGLGFGTEKSLLAVPWHSVDATNWELGPCKFGRWKTFGQMSVRGSNQNLRGEVLYYLEIERRAQARWRKEMAELADSGPIMRLACNGKGQGETGDALAAPPSVRLALSNISPEVAARRYSSLAPTVRLAERSTGRGLATMSKERL